MKIIDLIFSKKLKSRSRIFATLFAFCLYSHGRVSEILVFSRLELYNYIPIADHDPLRAK